MNKTEQYYWWCPECQEEVDGSRVTYQECHDVCGCHVVAKPVTPKPDESLLLNNKEMLVAINVYPTYRGEVTRHIGSRDSEIYLRLTKAQLAKAAEYYEAKIKELEVVIRELEYTLKER